MKQRSSVLLITTVGLFAAMAAALSFLESLLPSTGLPGVRLGLANIAVTAALWLLGAGGGAAVALVKVLFVLVTRGGMAAILSLAGTTAAFFTMWCLKRVYDKGTMTMIGVSVASAAAHTIGQLSVAAWLLSAAVGGYAPIMLLVCIPTGILTGCLLNELLPRLTDIYTRMIQKG